LNVDIGTQISDQLVVDVVGRVRASRSYVDGKSIPARDCVSEELKAVLVHLADLTIWQSNNHWLGGLQ
jgi:hypothetical protein